MNKIFRLFKFPDHEPYTRRDDLTAANRSARIAWVGYQEQYDAIVFARWIIVILMFAVVVLVIT